jgi:hypothetical protein
MNLNAQLPVLLPLAVSWAEQQSSLILQQGHPLSPSDTALAHRVGVRDHEAVRVLVVDAIPAPAHPLLRDACIALSFLGPNTGGLTLGHAIFVRKDVANDRNLIAHELRHVAQYEEQGCIAAYLSVYIPQLLTYGYENAPLELDAIQSAAACT